ncbi:MAG: GDSL-type esterase/lipase family protein, partial [Vicinamibacterales bacterium]|nr:GDSL-type esterase/lipase family protein [Vicinamibacterales bacterium]
MLSQRGRKLGGAAAIVLGAALTGCGAGAGSTQPVERATQGPTVAASAPSPIRDLGPLLVALGDSLTAGLGLETDQAYPALLERQLRTEGLDLTVINAGVSGDTTAAGLRRAEWALEGDVRAVIVALGGNDGLRGLPIDQMKQNLADIVSLARSRGIAVLLAG